jgi:chemotaxis protein MotB
MKFAFGVQNTVEVKDIPKGTSIIALEFRPGRPDPTPIDIVQQQTTEMTQQMLEFEAGDESSAGGRQDQRSDKRGGQAQSTDIRQAEQAIKAAAAEQVKELLKRLKEKVEDHIEDGALELESLGQQIIIRMREKGSFPSGSAFLQPQFKPIIRDIAELVKDVPGRITVSGHTDDSFISTELYASNWELSSMRAVAVAHEMVKVRGFEQQRLIVQGRADSQPLVPNTSAENRAYNRRVEISILQGKAHESEEIQVNQ